MANKDAKAKDGKKEDALNPDKLITYIGDDLKYWESLQTRFTKDHSALALQFMDFFEAKPKAIQNLFVTIRDLAPKVVLIDFSKHEEDYLHLARLLSRINSARKITVIGLLDYRSEPNFIKQCVVSGVKVNHIKSSEQGDIIFDAMYLSHGAISLPPFAIAKLNDDEVMASSLCKIGFVTADAIHLEANHQFSTGDEMQIDTFWLRKGMSKTPIMTVSETFDNGLFYNFKFGLDVAFNFADEVEEYVGMEEEDKEKLFEEREKTITECKERMANWIETNQENSKPKIVKILFVDKTYEIYRDKKRADLLPYVIRVQPYIKYPKREIGNMMPNIISYNYDQITKEEMEANEDIAYTYNESRTLKHIVKTIQSFEGYNPFIIIFNAKNTSEELQKYLKYSNIVVSKAELNTDIVFKMADKLCAKVVEKYHEEQDFAKVVLNKETPLSIAEYYYEINLQALTESFVYFKSQMPFDLYQTIKLKSPANMYITVVTPPEGSEYPDAHFALINTVGEEDKKVLRQFINSVFFREKELAKDAERADVEKKKEEAIAKKAAEAAAAEAAAQKAKEEEEEED